MKMNITYEFMQEYLPNSRCRNPRRRVMVTTADITVSEVKMEEFPVAFVVHDYKTREGEFQKVADPIHTYGGKLYTRWRVPSGKGTGDIQDISDLRERIKWCNTSEYESSVEEKFQFNEKSKVVGDNRKKHIDEMQEYADGFLIDDRGDVWEEIGEPMYHIVTFGLGHNHGGTGFFIRTWYNSNCSAETYFNALQYEEASRYFDQVALGRGDTESVGEWKDIKIDVLMPEMVKRNPAVEHADGGDPFMDALNGLCSKAGSVGEAALLTTAFTMASISAG